MLSKCVPLDMFVAEFDAGVGELLELLHTKCTTDAAAQWCGAAVATAAAGCRSHAERARAITTLVESAHVAVHAANTEP